MTHVMQNVTCVTLFGIISSKLHFCHKYWYSVVGRPFIKANNALLFSSFVGNTSYLDVTEVTKIAVSFQCFFNTPEEHLL